MTNLEIITTAMMLNGLDPLEDEVDTFAGWNRRGYSVKKGEHAKFSAKIWMPTKRKVTSTDLVEDVEPSVRMILVSAFFFTREQVDRRACAKTN